MPLPLIVVLAGSAAVSVIGGYIWEKHTPMGDGTYTRNEFAADLFLGAVGAGYIKQGYRVAKTTHKLRRIKKFDRSTGMVTIRNPLAHRVLFGQPKNMYMHGDALAVDLITAKPIRQLPKDVVTIASVYTIQKMAKSGPKAANTTGVLGGEIATGGRDSAFGNIPVVTKKHAMGIRSILEAPEVKKKKPSKMSDAQKKRLWRMGLRWCNKHKRYDKCSLRA
jgi:hypothetical protein